MKFLVLSALLSFAVVACKRADSPPLEISGTTVFAPLPGTKTAIAYMTIRNNTREDITIDSISSPQFDSATLHGTQIVAGVARMTRLATLQIPARSSAVLGEGGRHIMLMNPVQAVKLNQPVTLRIGYDIVGLVIVSTTLQQRFGHESTDQE